MTPLMFLAMFEEISRQMEAVCLDRGGTWKILRVDEGGFTWIVWWEGPVMAGWFGFDMRYIPHEGDTPYAKLMTIAEFVDERVVAMLGHVDHPGPEEDVQWRPWQLKRWWWQEKKAKDMEPPSDTH